MIKDHRGSQPVTWRQRLTLGGAVLGVCAASLVTAVLTRPARALPAAGERSSGSTVATKLALGAEPVVQVEEQRSASPEPTVDGEPVFKVGGAIRGPRMIRSVKVVYPPAAKEAGVEGRVILEAIVDKEGGIRKVKVVKGHPQLDAAAVEAVKQWRYEPAKKDGKPVVVQMTVTVAFKLQ